MTIDSLSQRVFLTTFMASDMASKELEENFGNENSIATIARENPVSRLRRASRTRLAGLFAATLVASQLNLLPGYGNEEAVAQTRITVPLPPGRTFTPEERAELTDYGWGDINQAKYYAQEFNADELTWLMWGEISPVDADDILKQHPQEEGRFEVVKDFVKKKYDDRFEDSGKQDLLNARVKPRIANSYPRVLPAETIISLYKRKEPVLPGQLRQRFTDDELAYFVRSKTDIYKALGYSQRWKAKDIAEFVNNDIPVGEPDIYPAERFRNAGYIIRIIRQGYSADYVVKYDEKFPEHFVAFFVENGISHEEANANFPKRLWPGNCLEIRKKHKDFPLRVLDDYPKHYGEGGIYAAAMAGMGVGYANAYPERLSGTEAVLLWKHHVFGEEASTYAPWLEAEQILFLKKRGVAGPQTRKYLADYPLEKIIAQERRKSR